MFFGLYNLNLKTPQSLFLGKRTPFGVGSEICHTLLEIRIILYEVLPCFQISQKSINGIGRNRTLIYI